MRTRIHYKEIEEGLYESSSVFNKYKVILSDRDGYADIKDILTNTTISFLTSDNPTYLRRIVRDTLKVLGTEFEQDTRSTKGEKHWKYRKKVDNNEST